MNWKQTREKLFNWELWPFALIYAPLAPLWLWYVAKAKTLWWFTPANPTLTFAGFDGEGKKEMYDLLPQELYPSTVYVEPDRAFDEVRQFIKAKGLRYPLCSKPQVGLKGLLFRKLDNEKQLQLYHQHVPVDYLIQEFVEMPLEVSVFYYRYPNKQKGVVSGFIQKDMMHLLSDGQQTVLELIHEHPKARHRLEEMRIKHGAVLKSVLPAGEKLMLTHAANLNRGATFTNLAKQIDPALNALFDPLSHRCQWYYGRYDIKCNSIEELKQGKFSILEFNGAGAEPNHVYNAGFSWPQALKVFAHHWKVLYEIARYNHKQNGVRYWGDKEGRRWMAQAKAHGELLKKYDQALLL